MRTSIVAQSFFFFMLVSCFSISSVYAYNLNIDFSAGWGVPSNSYGAASGQPGQWSACTQDINNNIEDIEGVSTPVIINVTADSYGGNITPCTGDTLRLFADYLYTDNASWTVFISGLNNGTYDIYLYAPVNMGIATGNMTVNGTLVSLLSNSTGDMVEGISYASLQTSITDGSLTITGDITGTQFSRAALAGLQLIESENYSSIPTLSEWGIILLSLGLAGIALYAIQRKKTV